MTQATDHLAVDPFRSPHSRAAAPATGEASADTTAGSGDEGYPPYLPLQARMYHYFEAACDRTPEATALEWEGGARTYAQLDTEANRLANYLLTHHLEPGSRVGLFLQRSHLLYVALLGAQKTGAGFVPIDRRRRRTGSPTSPPTAASTCSSRPVTSPTSPRTPPPRCSTSTS